MIHITAFVFIETWCYVYRDSEAALLFCSVRTCILTFKQNNVAASIICEIRFVRRNYSKMLQIHYITREPHRSVHWFISHQGDDWGVRLLLPDARLDSPGELWLITRSKTSQQINKQTLFGFLLACFASLLAPPFLLLRQDGECSFTLLYYQLGGKLILSGD